MNELILVGCIQLINDIVYGGSHEHFHSQSSPMQEADLAQPKQTNFYRLIIGILPHTSFWVLFILQTSRQILFTMFLLLI